MYFLDEAGIPTPLQRREGTQKHNAIQNAKTDEETSHYFAFSTNI